MYYVYKVCLKGTIVYIGYGKGARIDHAISGNSHNYLLNDYYFRAKLLGEELPTVCIVQGGLSVTAAKKLEYELIFKHTPAANIMLHGIKQLLSDFIKDKETKELRGLGLDYITKTLNFPTNASTQRALHRLGRKLTTLDDNEKKDIRDRLAKGVSVKSLAVEFKVSEVTIYKLRKLL